MSIATVPKTVGSPQSNQSQQKVLQARENKNMSSNAGALAILTKKIEKMFKKKEGHWICDIRKFFVRN